MVNTLSEESTVIVIVNGKSDEKVDKLSKLAYCHTHDDIPICHADVAVVLEALIFSEVSQQEFTKLINGMYR